MGDEEISPSTTSKFLGLHIDSRLTFYTQMDAVCGRLGSGIFVLNRLATFANTDVLLSAYYGLVYPYLTYGVEVWGHECVRTHFIFKLQKRAVRSIFKKPFRFHCKSLFVENKILTFPSIYIHAAVKYVHNNIRKLHVEDSTHTYNLRSRGNITIPKHKTGFFQNHLTYSGIRLYNSLPEHLKTERDPRVFARGVKQLLLRLSCYSVKEFLETKFT